MNAKPVERHGPYLVLDKNKENSAPKSAVLSIRINPELKTAMEKAANAGPYRIAITSLVERGIALAIRELDDLAKKAKKP